jgi:hypothetical protein
MIVMMMMIIAQLYQSIENVRMEHLQIDL